MNRPTHRRGGVMVIALVCMTVSMLLIGALLRLAVIDRRQIRADHSRLQSDWLAESALDRAAHRLRADPAYTGDQWEIPATDLGGRHAGRVEIAVAAVQGDNSRRSVTVVALYPVGADRFSQRTKTITVRIEPNP
jgi:type II secretory pathway component PulK